MPNLSCSSPSFPMSVNLPSFLPPPLVEVLCDTYHSLAFAVDHRCQVKTPAYSTRPKAAPSCPAVALPLRPLCLNTAAKLQHHHTILHPPWYPPPPCSVCLSFYPTCASHPQSPYTLPVVIVTTLLYHVFSLYCKSYHRLPLFKRTYVLHSNVACCNNKQIAIFQHQ